VARLGEQLQLGVDVEQLRRHDLETARDEQRLDGGMVGER
jgi:hypothetical protein